MYGSLLVVAATSTPAWVLVMVSSCGRVLLVPPR